MATATRRRVHGITIDVEYSGEAEIGFDEVQDWINACTKEELAKLDMSAPRVDSRKWGTMVSVDVDYDGEAEVETGDVQKWVDSASDAELKKLELAGGAIGYDNAIGINGTHAQALIDIDRIQELFDRLDTQEILARLSA